MAYETDVVNLLSSSLNSVASFLLMHSKSCSIKSLTVATTLVI